MKLTDYLKGITEGVNMEVNANLGYVITPNSIRRCLRLSQEEKMVLFEIYAHYNERYRYAYPTQQTLAILLGTSSSTVSKHLQKLQDKQFIEILGRKGAKKRYAPLFNLDCNPYLLLSEWTQFVIKELRRIMPETMGGDWANKVLQCINIKQAKEFTEEDFYGRFLLRLRQADKGERSNIRVEFFTYLTGFVCSQTGEEIKINWREVISTQHEQYSSKKSQYHNYKKGTVQHVSYDEEDDFDMGVLD